MARRTVDEEKEYAWSGVEKAEDDFWAYVTSVFGNLEEVEDEDSHI